MPRGQYDSEPFDDDELEPQVQEPEDDDETFLAELPDEVAQRLDKIVAKRNNQFKSEYGGKLKGAVNTLRRNGIDFGEDGKVEITDPERLVKLLGGDPRTAAQPQQRQQQEAEEDDLPAEIPSAEYEPEKFRDYVEKLADRKAAARTKAAQEHLQGLERHVQRGALKEALATAAETLEDYGLGDLVDHPRFPQALAEGLRQYNVPLEQWGDPEMIARVAGLINPDLRKQKRNALDSLYLEDEEQPRRRPRARAEEDDEPAPRRKAPVDREQLQRNALRNSRVDVSPSRGAERTERSPGYDPQIQKLARKMGITAAEAQSLKDPTGEAYQKHQAKQERIRR